MNIINKNNNKNINKNLIPTSSGKEMEENFKNKDNVVYGKTHTLSSLEYGKLYIQKENDNKFKPASIDRALEDCKLLGLLDSRPTRNLIEYPKVNLEVPCKPSKPFGKQVGTLDQEKIQKFLPRDVGTPKISKKQKDLDSANSSSKNTDKNEKSVKKEPEKFFSEILPHYYNDPWGLIPSKEIVYLKSIWRELIKTYPPAALQKVHNIQGVQTFLANKAVVNQLDYEHKYHFEVFKNWSRIGSFSGMFVDKVSQTVTNSNNSHFIPNQWDIITKEPPIDCQIIEDYPLREDIEIICKDGAYLDPSGYPKLPVSTIERWHSTTMFKLSHSVKPFVTYDNSPNNVCKAMKRIIGARKNEKMLIERERKMLADIDAHCDPHIAKTLQYTQNLSFEYETLSVDNVDKIKDIIVKKICSSQVIFTDDDKFEYFSTSSSPASIFSKYMIDRTGPTYLNQFLDPLKNDVKWVYDLVHDTYSTYYDIIRSRFTNANMPHLKKKLRLQYIDGQLIHDPKDILCKRLVAKVKRELAKFGKVPRLFVDYNSGCMAYNEVPEFVKCCIDGHHNRSTGLHLNVPDYIDYDIFITAKPRDGYMVECFDLIRRAQNTRNFLQFIIYSDDSMCCGNVAGVPLNYNMDISSCDSGNRRGVFALVGQLLSQFCPTASEGLLRQCMLPIDITDPNTSLGARFKIKIDGPFEGSGTVLTTILNHMASSLIAVNIIGNFTKLVQCGTDTGKMEEVIQESASFAGHLVTLELCPIFEKLQFLKHSPFSDSSLNWSTNLNYGCILRSLGQVEEDLTHIQVNLPKREFDLLTWEEKCNLFTGSVIAGLVHEPSSSIMDALRLRFPFVHQCKHSTYTENRSNQSKNNFVISNSSLCRRYNCDENEIQHLCYLISTIRVGSIFTCSLLDKIYLVDYGVV